MEIASLSLAKTDYLAVRYEYVYIEHPWILPIITHAGCEEDRSDEEDSRVGQAPG